MLNIPRKICALAELCKTSTDVTLAVETTVLYLLARQVILIETVQLSLVVVFLYTAERCKLPLFVESVAAVFSGRKLAAFLLEKKKSGPI